MLLTLIVPSSTMAGSSSQDDQQKQAENKLDAKLLEAYEKESHVRYLVILNEQTDTQGVAEKAKTAAHEQSLSTTEVKQSVQKAVVSELQTNAKTTQKNIMSYLEKDDKYIESFQSYFIVNGLAVTGTEQSARELAEFPEVKSIILDGKQQLPNLEKTTAETDDIEWNIQRVGAPEVWEEGITGDGAVVANIDSGVEENHPALKEKYRGYNPDAPEQSSHEFNWHDAVSDRQSPMDSDGHGTHTMGTMLGQEDDEGIGMAPEAQWISARAFFNDEGYDSYILEAAEWVLAPTDNQGVPHPDMAPDVVNNSWGGSPINNDWFLPMVQAWRAAGIVPVFSVGNTGLFQNADPGTASAPGNYQEVIAVGATDDQDKLADYSLRGPSEEGVTKPDLTAPGTSIRSSIPGESWDEFAYDVSNGTSMAAPHVAGAIALMKEADPDLTIEQIESILKVTATAKIDDDYSETPNNGYGYGLLDAVAAVDAAKQGVGTINGQIKTAGEDQEAPTYDHTPREVVYQGLDEVFSVQAMDNISVNDVSLVVSLQDGTEKAYATDQVDGDHLNGNYEVTVPAGDIIGDELKYWWLIEDFNGNQTASDEYVVKIKEGATAGYDEDFEKYPDGWYSYGTNNSWTWGVPEYGPDEAASGEKVMGTHLKGQYEMNSDMTLMMPPVLAEKGMILRFKNWYKLTQLGGDTGTVFASVDGEAWEPLYQVRQENTRWHEVGLDLSDFAGEKIQIAFNLQTADNENDGWYIDDVQLVDESLNVETTNQLYDEDLSFTLPEQDEKTLQPSVEPQMGQETSAENELPVEANITVEETGWETKTNPKDGEFSIHHPPGDYTLHVDAYGFESETVSLTVDEKGIVSPEIQLTPLPEQVISGKVMSSTGEPVEKATVFLLEDEQVSPVTTSQNGAYQLNAYEGTYTLKVYAEGYQGKTDTITVKPDEAIELDLTLDSFDQSASSEIKYDNGDYGKNLAFGKKGNGFAVRMSLDEGEPSAMLTGATLQFWADHVPVPGGDDILIAVYDATGPDGAPGNKLAGPIEAKAKRDLSSWTEVDLSHLGITVDDDFYIAYLQADDYPYIPGFVTDGDSSHFAERSWDYIGGQWFQADESAGNYMIRAEVDYGGEADIIQPVITTPEPDLLTNEKNITIEGTATPSTAAQVTNNGEVVDQVDVDDDGSFSLPMVLTEGENELVVTSLVDDEAVAESEAVTVTLDTEAPQLSIDSPQDGEIIDSPKITVTGTATDQHLEEVLVNEGKADIDNNGHYSKDITLPEGEQVIEVEAGDGAGNKTIETITINVDGEDDNPAFTIDNVTPTEDVVLHTGESVKVTFDSEPGLRATYLIHMPLTGSGPLAVTPFEMPLMELSDGHYVGYWTVPINTQASGARIEVKGINDANQEVSEFAEGRLFLNLE